MRKKGQCSYNGKCNLNLKSPEPPNSGKNVMHVMNNHVPLKDVGSGAWKKPNIELAYLDNTAQCGWTYFALLSSS